jgi:8-oxo-dGTP pyrophosphatase MutT (NUDIX family)
MTMGRRIDYYDDPAAPPANSVKPSASTFALRDGKVLLTQRADNGNWSMPSGAHDPGESLTNTAVRETLEETGITVRPI